ncbi:MAG: hypothetical protein QM662_02470 [Gordonia sp. (in: high G+C Gram-positive bacteria)]
MAVRIEWNRSALYEMRSDPALVAAEVAAAQRVCDEANRIGKGTYVVGSRQGAKRPQGRWRTSVVTADAQAMAHNAKHNVLIRAMGSA